METRGNQSLTREALHAVQELEEVQSADLLQRLVFGVRPERDFAHLLLDIAEAGFLGPLLQVAAGDGAALDLDEGADYEPVVLEEDVVVGRATVLAVVLEV